TPRNPLPVARPSFSSVARDRIGSRLPDPAYASRHTLVTLAQRPAPLSVLTNGAGSRSTDGVSHCCPKERTASPETDPARPDAGHRERTRRRDSGDRRRSGTRTPRPRLEPLLRG